MEGKIEDLAIRPAKVPKILQIGIFGMMNFRKKRRELKSQIEKFPHTYQFWGNLMKVIFCLAVILTSKCPQSQVLPKIS